MVRWNSHEENIYPVGVIRIIAISWYLVYFVKGDQV